jgi:hypothetical protein
MGDYPMKPLPGTHPCLLTDTRLSCCNFLPTHDDGCPDPCWKFEVAPKSCGLTGFFMAGVQAFFRLRSFERRTQESLPFESGVSRMAHLIGQRPPAERANQISARVVR